MTASVVRYDTIAMLKKEKELVVPIISA